MTADASDPSDPSIVGSEVGGPAGFTDEEVFNNIVEFESLFKRLIPTLIMLFLIQWAMCTLLLEASGFPMAGPLGAFVSGGVCYLLTRSKKRQFAEVWGERTLSLSPWGAEVEDLYTRVQMSWRQMERIGEGSILDPVRKGGFHWGGKAAGAVLAATMRRKEVGILGVGRVTLHPDAPRLLKTQVRQNYAGQDLQRAQAGLPLTHFDKDWENGRIGQWIRVYRPDLMSSSGALVTVGEEEVSTRHGSTPEQERQSGRPRASEGHDSVGVPAAASDSAVDGYRPPGNRRRRRLALVVLAVGLLPFLFYSGYLRSGNDVGRASGVPESVLEGLKRQSDAIDHLANGTPPTAPPQLGEIAPQAPPQLPPQLAGTPEGRLAEFYAAQQQIDEIQRQFEQQNAALEQLMADQRKQNALYASNMGISTAISALEGFGELKDPLHVMSWEVSCDVIALGLDVPLRAAVAEWLQANADRYGIEFGGHGAVKLAGWLVRGIDPVFREGLYGACKSLSFPDPGARGA